MAGKRKAPPQPGNVPNFKLGDANQGEEKPKLKTVSPKVSKEIVLDDIAEFTSGEAKAVNKDPRPIEFAGELFHLVVGDKDLGNYLAMIMATAETPDEQMSAQAEVFRAVIRGGEPEYERFRKAWNRVGREYYKQLQEAKAAGTDGDMDSYEVWQNKLFKNFSDGVAEAYDPKE